MNVLLVDDDEVFNFLGRKVLQRLSFVKNIDTAINGKEALNLIQHFFIGEKPLPDLILLDVNMPIMNGFEFLNEFSTLPLVNKDRVRIVMVSSSQDVRDIERAKSFGITEYLVKPLLESSLREILEQ